MQLRMTYAQAQKLILDIAKQLAPVPGGDVVVTLPDPTPPKGADDPDLPLGAVAVAGAGTIFDDDD